MCLEELNIKWERFDGDPFKILFDMGLVESTRRICVERDHDYLGHSFLDPYIVTVDEVRLKTGKVIYIQEAVGELGPVYLVDSEGKKYIERLMRLSEPPEVF